MNVLTYLPSVRVRRSFYEHVPKPGFHIDLSWGLDIFNPAACPLAEGDLRVVGMWHGASAGAKFASNLKTSLGSEEFCYIHIIWCPSR